MTITLLNACEKNTPQIINLSGKQTLSLGIGSNNITNTSENNTFTNRRNDSTTNAPQFDIDNTRYLFVVGNHTVDELEALLRRADEIAQKSRDQFNELKIAIVIHGENITMFTQDNYEKNKLMIDLAAKLDTYNVIDLKMCEYSMDKIGINKNDIPEFIDTVPFAPDEIKRLTSEGYLKL